MLDTFKDLEFMQQLLWGLAAISSLVFVIQAIGVFIGFDADFDADAGETDFDAEGFHLVSVKSIVCFVLGFSWTGVIYYDRIESTFLLGLLCTVVGLIFMSLIAFALFQVRKLSKDNTFRTEQAVGQNADVYLRIPGLKSETGKVTVSVNGSMHELEAMTEDADEIPTGAKVLITGVLQSNIVLVSRI